MIQLGSLYGPEESCLVTATSSSMNNLISLLSTLKSPLKDSKYTTMLQETSELSLEASRYMTAETYMCYGSYDSMYSMKQDRPSQVVTDIKNEIRGIKGDLLSTRNFPNVHKK